MCYFNVQKIFERGMMILCGKEESRWKNAQIEMVILGKNILIEYIDIEVVRTYTKKTPRYNI